MSRRTDQPSALHELPPLAPAEAAAYAQGRALRALAEARADGWVNRCLEAALEAEHPFPRGEARLALQQAPAPAVVRALLPALTSQNRRLRRRAMTLLPRLEAAELLRQMKPWVTDASREGKKAACGVLGAVGEEGTALLRVLARDADSSVARRAARALAVNEERAAQAVAAPRRGTMPESARRPFGLPPPRGAMPERTGTFAVAAFNFSYGVNLGVLIRSAEAAGARAVWVVGRDFYYRPSTKGSDWWIPVELLPTPMACIERARAEGYAIVALQQGPAAQSLYDAKWPQQPLIVVGNEGDGLPTDFVEAADLQVGIPVAGRIDSLNVAVAATVGMYFYLRAQERRST